MYETVLCYIENNKNEYLMLYRNKKEKDINKNKYIGIGGHIEDGESPSQALKREVYEETGLYVFNFHFRGVITFYIDDIVEKTYLYTVNDYFGELKECDEGEFTFIKKNDIFNYPLWEGDKYFLELLLKDEPFFDVDLYYENNVLVKHKVRRNNESLNNKDKMISELSKYIKSNLIKETIESEEDEVIVDNNIWKNELSSIITNKNLDETKIYSDAYISFETIQKIRNINDYVIDKDTIIKLSLSLKLSLNETIDLMEKAGYSLSDSNEKDLMIKYFINNGIYNIMYINDYLYTFNLPNFVAS